MKEIPLTQGLFATVDDADFERVSAYKWCAHCPGGKTFYAVHGIKVGAKWTVESLHKFLLPDVRKVDHKNGNGLDCRRENMRPATSLQNSQGFRHLRTGTTSKFRGVFWNTYHQRWTAKIKVQKVSIHLGHFKDEVEAAKAYDEAARKFFDEFAAPNFPTENNNNN